MAGSRRTVTILFSDLVGSTELAERLDAETLRDALDRYFEEARLAVERHGGLVEKFIGDAVMAVFGLPDLHEDDAMRAIRAARAMHEAVLLVNEGLDRDFGVRLRMRTGVHTGEVVTGDPAVGERFVTGDAVNVAARLEQIAEPDTIVVGADTYRLTREACDYESLPPLDLKGKGDPVEAHRLVALVDRDSPWEASRGGSFVGREAELSVIQREFLFTRTESAARAVTIIGEAGIGKSRLAAEVLRTIDADASVLRGRCVPYGDGMTYWPLMQVLRTVGRIDEDDDYIGVGRKLREAPPRPPPEPILACLVSVLGGPGTYPVEEVSRAFRLYLEAIAGSGSLVLLLEDLHWAEPTLLDLVENLSRALAPLLILCTARPELLETRPGWGDMSKPIRLEPLPSDQAERLVADLIPVGLSGPIRDRVVDAAGGNPFFLEQIVSMLHDEGSLTADAGVGVSGIVAMPPSVAAVLDARIDRLPEHVRHVAQRGAIVGKIFYRRAVEVLSEPDEDLGRSIAQLIDRGFVEPHVTDLPGEEAFAFRHILIRDAFERGTLKRRRAVWHEVMANWLEEQARGLGGQDELVGFHLEQACRLRSELGVRATEIDVLSARASALLARAARRAADRNDAPAAASLFGRALALEQEESTRCRLMIDLALAHLDAGAAAEALSTTGLATELAHQVADPTLNLRATVASTMVALYASSPDLTTTRAEIGSIVEQLTDKDDREAMIEAVLASGVVDYSLGYMSSAAERFAMASELAAFQEDVAKRDRALDWLIFAMTNGSAPVSFALIRCEEIIGSSRSRSRVEAAARSGIAILRALTQDVEGARAEEERSRAIYEELAMPLEVAVSSQASAAIELLAGEPALVEADLRRDRELLAQREAYGYLITTEMRLAQVLQALGRHQEAREVAHAVQERASMDDPVTTAMLASLDVRYLVAQGRPGEAEAVATRALDAVQGRDRYDVVPGAYVDLADVMIASGRPAQAVPLLYQARRLHQAKENAAMLSRVDSKIDAVERDLM